MALSRLTDLNGAESVEKFDLDRALPLCLLANPKT